MMGVVAVSAVWMSGTTLLAAPGAKDMFTESDGLVACMQAAKSASAHPSTVEFSTSAVSYSLAKDGTIILTSFFTARNSYNLELKYRIRCLFDGKKLVGTRINEAE